MFKKTATIIFLLAMFLGTGLILVKAYPDFKTSTSSALNKKPLEVTIEFWGLWDNSDSWNKIIERFENKTHNFNGQRVNVSIIYTKKELSFYEENLSKARQKNNEPNIFMINNNWLEKYIDWLKPLSENKAYAEEYNLIKYEELLSLFPIETLRNLINNDRLYGLPLYSDSLALYYNKDLLEKAEIESPPKTWKEFKKAVKKLTVIDRKNKITQLGAALGTGKNINRSPDILALLMMQGGAKVIDEQGNIDINKEIEINTVNGAEKRSPGKRAILFYTEFSNPKKEIYTWNSDQENSIKLFANGKLAMMINYSYQMKNLLALNPYLNYGISKMPQLENSTPVNFSNVWTPVVSKNNNCKVEPVELSNKIDCSKIAWSFLSFASQKENARLYLDSTNKAAARKDLIAEQISLNNKTSVFASQADSAMSYNKFDDRIDGILTNMIDEINLDRENWGEKVDKATEEIERLR
jgi:multiple sugar transport system substrate-binding protein